MLFLLTTYYHLIKYYSQSHTASDRAGRGYKTSDLTLDFLLMMKALREVLS